MRRVAVLGLNALVIALSLCTLSGVAYPCSVVRAGANISLFDCPCGETVTPIYVVTGTLVLTNRRASPTLASIVVELSAKQKSKYVVVARQVLDEANHSVVDTCLGSFAAGPIAGHIVLTDGMGMQLSFADVKNLPEGTVTLHYIATFAGNIPEIILGQRVKVKAFTTLIGAHANATCSIDADGDGSIDSSVRTLTFQKIIKVPAQATDLTP